MLDLVALQHKKYNHSDDAENHQ